MRKFLRSLFVRQATPAPAETPAFRAVMDAARNLETVWGQCIAYEAAGHFTCNEAEALAELFTVIGLEEVAERFLEGHAHADDDEDDMHHSEYLELTSYRPAA